MKERTALAAKDGSCWPKGKPLIIYGEDRLSEGSAAGYRVLVEGESDCWTCWYHGFPALGLPGNGTVSKTLAAGHVFGVNTLYVVQEPDGGGAEFVRAAAARLAELRWNGELRVVRLDGFKDPSDLHKGYAMEFKERFRESLDRASVVPLVPPTAAPGRSKARSVLPYQPLPVEALPQPLAEYVRQGALFALGCDPAFVALPAMSVLAGMIGYTRVLRLKTSWRVPCVLWTLVVADSGSLKTPAFPPSTRIISLLSRKRLDLAYKERLAEYAEAKATWDAAVKAAKKGEGDPPGDEPEPPVRQTLFTSDATIEAIAELIGENPRGLLVACDELAGWLGSFSRYKGKAGGTDLPRWLSMHSAGGFAYHRKTGDRRRIVVPHAAVSIAGGIQPGVLARALAGESLEAGLAGRLNMAMPPKPSKVWTELEIDPDTEKHYQDLLDSLHRLEFDKRNGEDAPHVLKLSKEAKDSWIAWYNAWAAEQAAVQGDLAAAFSKLEEGAARLALLHHVVTRVARGEDDLVPVQQESMDAGIVLARWFAQEAKRIYSMMSESTEERTTRQLVEFVRTRGGRITAKELQRSSRKYPDADAATQALDALVQAGYGPPGKIRASATPKEDGQRETSSCCRPLTKPTKPLLTMMATTTARQRYLPTIPHKRSTIPPTATGKTRYRRFRQQSACNPMQRERCPRSRLPERGVRRALRRHALSGIVGHLLQSGG